MKDYVSGRIDLNYFKNVSEGDLALIAPMMVIGGYMGSDDDTIRDSAQVAYFRFEKMFTELKKRESVSGLDYNGRLDIANQSGRTISKLIRAAFVGNGN